LPGAGATVTPEPKHPWLDETFDQVSIPFRDGDDLRHPSPGPVRDLGGVVSAIGAAAILAVGFLLVK
jgi:hypothetical protein